MFFGDGGSGKGTLMPGATIPNNLISWYSCYAMEVIGHELTHGVVQESAGLAGSLEASTLNESIADCMGMMIKHWAKNLLVEESDWDMCPGFWADTTVKTHKWTKNYMRTFRKPDAAANEGQVEAKSMSEWVSIDDPHPNCGIPNHAFYLAAQEFGGYAWKSIGRIWYNALVDPSLRKSENQNFEGFALLTCAHARKLFGSKAEAIVRQAWTIVEVLKVADFGPKLGSAHGPTQDEITRRECTTAQYHSVVIISEDMLNAQLQSYYNIEPKLREMKVEHSLMRTGIDAELDPPRIQIPTSKEALDKSKVIYHVRIRKGKISYTSIPPLLFNPAKHSLKQVEIKNWDFAFQVNLDMESVNSNDRADVKKMLRVAGEYSIQRLLLNFGMANTTNFISEVSKLKMPDGSAPPQALCVSLGEWVKHWTVNYKQIENRLQGKETFVNDDGEIDMADANCPILYHALAPEPEKVNPRAPTIPPTSVIVQTYQFERPGSKDLQIPGRNSIAYTEMCMGAKIPTPSVFDSTNGNFVTDTRPWSMTDDLKIHDSNILGSTCLSSEILFGKHFSPHLKPIVKLTQIHLVSCSIGGSNNEYQWEISFNGNPDYPDYQNEYYSMKRMPGKDSMWDTRDWFGGKGDNPGNVENKWGYRWVMETASIKNAKSLSTFKDIYLTLEARSVCDLVPQVGTNRVTLSGATTIAIYASKKVWLSSKEDKGHATTGRWSLDFVIKTTENVIKDGQLNVEVEYAEPFVRFDDWTSPKSVSGFDGKRAIESMKQRITSNIAELKSYIENSVKSSLKQSQFVLAGSGYFTMHNPIFTTKGDLLVEIKYKGIPPNGNPLDEKLPQQLGTTQASATSLAAVPSFVNEGPKVMNLEAKVAA